MKNWKVYTIAAVAPLALAACATDEMTSSQANMVAENNAVSDVHDAEIAELNELVSIYIDASTLYDEAADIPDNDEAVRDELQSLASERAKERDDLQARVIALGGRPDEMGQAVGTGHRAFTQLRTLVDQDSEVAIEEVLRGEKYIAEEIDEALEGTITVETREMLTALKSETQQNIADLEKLDRQA